MKYLKEYYEFSSIKDEIKDILLPIEDEFKVEIQDFEKIDMFYIKLETQNPKFNDDIEHLTIFMKSEGYDNFIGKAIKNQTDISFFKPSEKNKEIEKFFIDYIKDLTRETSKDYPYSIFWVKGPENEVYFHQDLKNEKFWTKYSGFWKVFGSKYDLNSQETQAIVRYLVGKHLKLECLTPLFYQGQVYL
jgi:hypothetical protein